MKFSWNKSSQNPRLVIITEDEDDEFDPTTLQHWREEGFAISYIPLPASQNALVKELHDFADGLELGEKYAVVALTRMSGLTAYERAAEVMLEIALKPIPKLCALVAYYPNRLPMHGAGYPTSLKVLVHMAGTHKIPPKIHAYSYPHAAPGFAESDLDEYDKISAGLAWSRSLEVVRKAFEIEVDMEGIWEDHTRRRSLLSFVVDYLRILSCHEIARSGSSLTFRIGEFAAKDADGTMSTMVDEPYVNHIPTMTGGIGYKDLHKFYQDYFIPGNPPSLKMRLISRTIGTDRVVDELFVSFQHTQEVPWVLPGVAPTNKHVEFALVAIVCIRGGKLYHEHIYWDQATVLVQVGLLDPKLSGKGFKRLPVVDGAGARKVLDEASAPSNELIPGWKRR
ncbi:hypothetical protein Q9189_007347 [Teloschistes chrysophthalmus]